MAENYASGMNQKNDLTGRLWTGGLRQLPAAVYAAVVAVMKPVLDIRIILPGRRFGVITKLDTPIVDYHDTLPTVLTRFFDPLRFLFPTPTPSGCLTGSIVTRFGWTDNSHAILPALPAMPARGLPAGWFTLLNYATCLVPCDYCGGPITLRLVPITLLPITPAPHTLPIGPVLLPLLPLPGRRYIWQTASSLPLLPATNAVVVMLKPQTCFLERRPRTPSSLNSRPG